MFYMRDVGWGWESLMVIIMVAFWALVLYGAFWLVRRGGNVSAPPTPPTPPPAPKDTPLEILDRRFANGELTVEEYRERREVLEHHREPASTEA